MDVRLVWRARGRGLRPVIFGCAGAFKLNEWIGFHLQKLLFSISFRHRPFRFGLILLELVI